MLDSLRNTIDGWRRFWLEPCDSLILDFVRVCFGAALFMGYAAVASAVQDLYGLENWFTGQGRQLYIDNPWRQSALYFFSQPWQITVFYYAFLASIAAFAAGWKTRWAKWMVLIGHTSFAYSNPLITYGVDSVVSSVLLLFCIAPIGEHLSLDAAARLRRRRSANSDGQPVYSVSSRTTTALRLLQLQMAVIFFFAASTKLAGDFWWSGDAIWVALNNPEFINIPIDWLPNNYLAVNALTYGTLLIEISYVFLIWQKASRPYLLTCAILLHLGIAVLMGLYFFSAVMIACHLCFMRREWIVRLTPEWVARHSPMEMISDVGRAGRADWPTVSPPSGLEAPQRFARS